MSLVAVLRDSVGTSYIVASRQIVVKVERSVLTKINEDVMLCYVIVADDAPACY